MSETKVPVVKRSLDDRLLDFALVTLRNQPDEVRQLGMRHRALWAADHVVTIARCSSHTVSEDQEHRLALNVEAAALADLDTYGR